MMRQVIHLSIILPVHNASSDALWPVKDFYRKSGHLNKIILNYISKKKKKLKEYI